MEKERPAKIQSALRMSFYLIDERDKTINENQA